MKKYKGISLIVLIITILVIIVLAGAVILLLTENNPIRKANKAVFLNDVNSFNTELSLYITDQYVKTNSLFETTKLNAKKHEDSSNNILQINKVIPSMKGRYLDIFEVKEGKLVYIGTNEEEKEWINESEGNNNTNTEDLVTKKQNAILFDGLTYIKTNLKQTDIFDDSNGQYTIAFKIKLNKALQSSIDYMGIYGEHYYANGIAMQFQKATTTLYDELSIDYTPYYDNWTDIIITYSNNTQRLYINDVLVKQIDGSNKTPLGDFIIGTSYIHEERCMKGMIASFKIWKKALTEEDVKKVNLLSDNTTIKSDSIVLETIFDSIEDVNKIGTIIGSNYYFVPRDRNFEDNYALRLNGGVYINTNIQESEILPNTNGEITIATQLKLSRQNQVSKNYMGIIGNHIGGSGIAYQFNGTSTQLGIGHILFNFTPYYDRWIDLVWTYNNGLQNLYIDGNLIDTKTGNLTPYLNLLIGTAYNGEDRTFIGLMSSIKIWKKSLSQDEVKQIDMLNNTNVQKDNLFKEIRLNSLNNISKIGNIVGSNYTFEYIDK